MNTLTAAARRTIPVVIRWQLRLDMPTVLEIERSSFEFPWTEEDFICFLRNRRCIGMVAEHAGRVVGFMEYEVGPNAIRLRNLAVCRLWRRLGVGSQMVAKLIRKLYTLRRKRIVVTVRESNLPAQLFFRACGFVATKVLRGTYDDTPEDAYVMVYRHSRRSTLDGL